MAIINGTDGNDNLNGTSVNDTIFGADGNDTIFAGNGNDIVYGGNGNDYIWGDYGQDTIYGEAGDDFIVGAYGGKNYISGGDGNDTIRTNGQNDTLDGGNGNDIISGSNYNDTIIGGTGNDNLQGGSGVDTYIFNIGDGQDTINDSSGINTVRFSVGIALSDLKFSKSGNNLIIRYGLTDQVTIINNFINQNKLKEVKIDPVTTLSIEGFPLETMEEDIFVTYEENTICNLSENAENLTLKGSASYSYDNYINDKNVIVYGSPFMWADYLDYYQGDNSQRNEKSCLYVSLENLLIQVGLLEPRTNYTPPFSGIDQVESSIIKVPGILSTESIDTNDVISIFSPVISEINTLYASKTLDSNNFITETYVSIGTLGNYIKEGRCIIALCDSDVLWENSYSLTKLDHAITVTGVVYDKDNPNTIEGFYICDSGRQLSTDVVRFISYDLMSRLVGGSAYILATNSNTKQYIDYIDGKGNELDNLIIGNSARNTLWGLTGNDTLNGAGQADTLYGGTGDDFYYINNKDTVIEQQNEGTDTVCIITNSSYTLGNNIENLILGATIGVQLTGNNLNNNIKGSSGNDTIYGGDGADTLDGDAGYNTLIGGLGDDAYIINSINDKVLELSNQGTDTIISGITYSLSSNLENLTLTGTTNINGKGNSFNNFITGNDGNNILTAYNGNDTLDGGIGADTMIGGAGSDTYCVDNTGDIITEECNSTFKSYNSIFGFLLSILKKPEKEVDTVISSISYTLANNLENLTLLGTDNINATGNALNNVITGNSGNNILDGGIGRDTMIGGAGDDKYIVNNKKDVILENFNEGVDTVKSNVSYSLVANLENLTLTAWSSIDAAGNSLANIITGNDGNNVLIGNAGNDTINGSYGNDTYIFNIGDDIDTIIDSSGTDSINLGNNVNKYNIAFFKDSSGMFYLDYGDSTGVDKIIVNDWNNTDNQIEKILLADNTYLSNTEINAIIQNMISYSSNPNNHITLNSINDVKNSPELLSLCMVSWHS